MDSSEEAWASLKSFRKKTEDEPTTPPDDPGNPTVNFHGESRRNDTHESSTDPDARLARKGAGKEAKLAHAGHVLLDNRHGLVANVCVTPATGTAEREAAYLLLDASAPPGSTVGGDKGFDVRSFVAAVRDLGITHPKARGICEECRLCHPRDPSHRSGQCRSRRRPFDQSHNRPSGGSRRRRYSGRSQRSRISSEGWSTPLAAGPRRSGRRRDGFGEGVGRVATTNPVAIQRLGRDDRRCCRCGVCPAN